MRVILAAFGAMPDSRDRFDIFRLESELITVHPERTRTRLGSKRQSRQYAIIVMIVIRIL